MIQSFGSREIEGKRRFDLYLCLDLGEESRIHDQSFRSRKEKEILPAIMFRSRGGKMNTWSNPLDRGKERRLTLYLCPDRGKESRTHIPTLLIEGRETEPLLVFRSRGGKQNTWSREGKPNWALLMFRSRGVTQDANQPGCTDDQAKGT